MVVVGDDAGVPRSKGGKVGRRGIAGTVLVQKIAGALAATGYVTPPHVRSLVTQTAMEMHKIYGTEGVSMESREDVGSLRTSLLTGKNCAF